MVVVEEAEEEEEEQVVEEERRRDADYLDFRRRFDRLKQDHEGMAANCEKLKNQGNNFFKLGLYTQASMMYSEAIELQPENAVLYCNRAMAYLKQEMPHEALADSERSLELDDTVSNIKAYWRKSQSLLDLGRLEESEATADTGLVLQPGNQHINRVRRKAREAATLLRLCGGEWTARMENGVEKRYVFEADGSMKIYVFGHFVPATFDLSVEGNPRSMVVRMKPEGIGFGNGPPPPPRPYIFEFHDGDRELWMCTPVGSDLLPEKFEGPGFDRLRRSAESAGAAAAVGAADGDEPLDSRCERYLRDMTEAMPLLPPQLPEAPSEQQISQETMVLERISQLKRKFGVEVHQRAVELAKCPSSAPTPALAELALQLQQRFVARRILPPPPPPEPAAAKAEASIPGAHQDGGGHGAAAAPAATAASRSSGSCLRGLSRLCCGDGR